MGRRLLLVEDDRGIAESLAEGLERHGFEVVAVGTGAAALVGGYDVDLVLLDLGLPDIDGKDVCRRLHAETGVPIIVITARGDELDRVLLLELGADDYLVKPFGLRELVARIGAVLRRVAGTAQIPSGRQLLGAVAIERDSRRVFVDGDEVQLTPKEFDLLVALADRPGTVVTREDLIDQVWDTHWFGPTKTLDVHVAALRRKLGHDLIATVRGVGYRLEAPV